MDQSLFAAPHGLSQRITSFFACACQGIHQMPLRHLIVLIANAHLPSGPKPRRAATFYNDARQRSHRHVNFDDLSITDNTFALPREQCICIVPGTRRALPGGSSDQLLEIMSDDARSGNVNHAGRQSSTSCNNTRV